MEQRKRSKNSIRVLKKYDNSERNIIEKGSAHLGALLDADYTDRPYSEYQNQTAKLLCDFYSVLYNVWSCVIALTQSGKTRLIHCFVNMFIKSNTIPYEHIFIITGHSSTEWKEQTKKRFPRLLHENILHRSDLRNKETIKKLSDIENALIIIDECHVASEISHTINKLFIETKIKEEYAKRDIKIVCISATPNGIASDVIRKLDQGTGFFIMKPTDSYLSIFKKLDEGKVFEARNLSGRNRCGKVTDSGVHLENQKEILKKINEFETPKYHFIRLPVGNRYEFCKQEFEKHIKKNDLDFEIKEYTDKQEIRIDDIVRNEPVKPTLVFIKEKLRCAKSVDEDNKMKHIGIVYDRITSRDDVANQGLAGRTTGYGVNKDIIVFTNISSVERYRAIWNLCLKGKFDEAMRLKWNSTTTNNKKGTYMSCAWIGICHNNENKEYTRECNIITFNDMKSAKKFMKNLKFNNPYNGKEMKLYGNVRKRNTIKTADGNEFYCDSLRERDNTKPRSFGEVIDQVSKKTYSSKGKKGKKTFHHSNYFVGYLKPPKLKNGKWVGGNNKTLRIVIPLPLLCNYYHDSIPLLENLDDYNDYMTKEHTVVKQKYKEDEFIEYMEFINQKYNIKLEYVEVDDE